MIYHNQNDETLVLLTLAGKKEAYESLVVRYQQVVIKEAVFIGQSLFDEHRDPRRVAAAYGLSKLGLVANRAMCDVVVGKRLFA